MITFELTSDQELARDIFQTAARDILRPAARATDDAGAIAPETLAKIRSLGLAEVQAHDSYDAVRNAIVLEELGSGDATLALSVGATASAIRAIERFGSPDQIQRFARTAEDRLTTAIAITEPGFDFDITELTTCVRREGSGHRLNGEKSYVPMARDCTFLLVVAQADDGQAIAIVPMDLPGITIEDQQPLGLRGLRFGKVRFDDVDLPADLMLGRGGAVDVQQVIDSARIGTAAVLNGVSRAIYDYVVDYTRQRVVHGSPLAHKQSVGFRLVDMHMAIETMRWMNWKAASELADGADTTTRSACLAHDYACEQAMWIADEGVQLLGGHGFLKDHPVELWYRDTRCLGVLEGLAGV